MNEYSLFLFFKIQGYLLHKQNICISNTSRSHLLQHTLTRQNTPTRMNKPFHPGFNCSSKHTAFVWSEAMRMGLEGKYQYIVVVGREGDYKKRLWVVQGELSPSPRTYSWFSTVAHSDKAGCSSLTFYPHYGIELQKLFRKISVLTFLLRAESVTEGKLHYFLAIPLFLSLS